MKTSMIFLRAIAPLVRVSMACVALALLATGCRDATNIVDSGQPLSKPSITPRANLVMRADTALVTVWLDVRGDVGKIGSFTGRLRYDQAVLEYGGEVPVNDGALRAVNAGAGEVRVAGASAAGVDRTSLAQFRFRVRNATGNPDLQFDLDELHELSRADARANMQRRVGSRTVR